MATRDLTDIRITPKGVCGYIMSVKPRVWPCHKIYVTIFQKHCHSVVLVIIETLSVRYYAARLETVLEAEEKSW